MIFVKSSKLLKIKKGKPKINHKNVFIKIFGFFNEYNFVTMSNNLIQAMGTNINKFIIVNIII